ncbi:MAG TPA: M56 family metallopeptidase [Holophaga sp.]|nr:M56 family metallopeptidase [Holophaga sp.]
MSSAAFLSALAWALIHFLWQGVVLGLGTWVLLRFLRKARPQTRYALACLALIGCLVLPVTGVIRGLASGPAAQVLRVPLEAGPPAPPMVLVEAASAGASAATSANVATDLTLATRMENALRPHFPKIVFVWALGALLLALRLGWGLARVQGLGRHGKLADEAWTARLEDLAKRLGISQPVRLWISEQVRSPMTVGWWRPIVLVPASLLSNMPPELLEALLAHELAHIRRYDYLVNLVASAVEVLLFYHPAVWMISRWIRIEREQIADDLAAKALGEPRRLALALSELDHFQLDSLNLAQAAHGGHLMARIRQLIQPHPRPLAWKAVISLLALAVLFAGGATATARSAMSTFSETEAAPVPPPAPPAPKPSLAPEPPPVPPPPPAPAIAGVKLNGPSCALIRPGQGTKIHFTGNSQDFNEIFALQKVAKTDLLWFRDGEKTYTIDDPALVNRIAKQRKPLEDIERRQADLTRQIQERAGQLGAMGAEMGALAAGMSASITAEVNQEVLSRTGQIGNYATQMGGLAARLSSPGLSESERDAIEKQMDELEKKMDALGKEIDAAGKRIEAKAEKHKKHEKGMEEAGRRMEEAAKPIEALGQQIKALDQEQEKHSPAVLKAIQDLISEAIQKGKAKPVETMQK